MSSQEEYLSAVKSAKKEMAARQAAGLSTQLPALDTILKDVEIRGEVPLGLIDIPAERIVGTKTVGRTSSFAPNFMPLLDDKSEFGIKWKNLCTAHLEEGIRDPIQAYEYLNKYYVLEGNKRVSVLKYFEAPTIPGYVTRVIPAWEDKKEIRIYYEFLEFYNASSINYISFTREGSYIRLVHRTGHKRNERWTMDDRVNFRVAYHCFTEAFRACGGGKLACTPADALLIYLEVFSYEELCGQSEAEVRANLKQMWEEFLVNETEEEADSKVAMKLDPTPDPKQGRLSQILTPAKPVRIGFLYKKTVESSGWTYSHELGRNYLDQAFHGEVETRAYDNLNDSTEALAAMEKAIADGCSILFATTPEFLTASLKAAVKYPKIKILNCSLNVTHPSIRTYYGRMFEAKFLNGVLAGILTDTDKIGYIADYPIGGMTANINAFAIGAKSVNPDAKILLEWSTAKENEGVNLTEKLYSRGATLISHQDMIVPRQPTREFGLYRIGERGPVNLAFPVWDWGKFYERIIRNVRLGTWNTESRSEADKAISYWWGMSAGVIDVVWSDSIPAGTRALLSVMKQSILRYEYTPFSGVLYGQEGIVQPDPNYRLTSKEIIEMKWLSDNVVGSLPAVRDLKESTKPVVRQEGVLRKEAEEAEE